MKKSMRGLSTREAHGAIVDEAAADPAGIGEGRQQQRVEPDGRSGGDARHGAPRRAALPHETAEEGGRELRNGSKGDEAHLRQRRRGADHPVIAIGECKHQHDGPAPDEHQAFAHVVVNGDALLVPLAQQKRHDEVVADHDRQRDALHDHHGGGGGQSAEEGDHGEDLAAGVDRQRQHEGVADPSRAADSSRPAMAMGMTKMLMATR